MLRKFTIIKLLAKFYINRQLMSPLTLLTQKGFLYSDIKCLLSLSTDDFSYYFLGFADIFMRSVNFLTKNLIIEIEFIESLIFLLPSILYRKVSFKYTSKYPHSFTASLLITFWVLVTKAEHLFLSVVDIAGAFNFISRVGFNVFTAA